MSCKLCMPRGKCKDDDVAAVGYAGTLISACADVPAANGGTCDLSGPVLSNPQALGITAFIVDAVVQSCPLSCGRCTKPPPCVDDTTQEASTLAPIKSGWTCPEAVFDNGGHCGVSGKLFQDGGLLAGFDNTLFKTICKASCHVCVSPTKCGDYDKLVLSLTASLGGYSCKDVVALNGGDCSWSGPVLSQGAVFGQSLLEQIVWACSLSCDVCYRDEMTCIDDSVQLKQEMANAPSCSYFLEDNDWTCEWGHMAYQVSSVGVTPQQMQTIVAKNCPRTCDFCVPSLISTPVPTMEIEEVIYLVESPNNPGSGGMYILQPENVTCNFDRVWKKNSTQFPEYYILTDPEGYWIVTDDLATPAELEQAMTNANNTCNNLEPVTRSMEPHGVQAPFLVEWGQLDLKHKTWKLDVAVRMQLSTCKGASQCLQLNCQEPVSTSYTCEECTLHDAQLHCTHGGTPLRVFMVIIVFLAICFVTGGNLWYVKTANKPPPTPRASRRFSIPTTAVAAHNPCLVMLQKYRKAFLQYLGLLGNLVARYRWCFFISVVTVLILFIPTGAPLFEVDTSEQTWVPEGGRLEREMKFVDAWTDDTKQAKAVFVMVGSDNGKSALDPYYAKMMLKILIELRKVKVPLKHKNGTVGMMVGWDDFCASIDHPMLDQIMPGGKPCINPSILDCFYEGAWMLDDVSLGHPLPVANQSILYKNLKQAVTIAETVAPGALIDYEGRPSLQNMTAEEMLDIYSQFSIKCDHWAIGVSLTRGGVFGSYEAGEEPIPMLQNHTKLITADKVLAYVAQYSAKRTKEFKKQLEGYDERDIGHSMDQWYDALSDKLQEMDGDEVNYPHTSVSVFMTVSINRMFKKIGSAKIQNFIIGWFIITAYVIFTQFDKEKSENHVVVGVIGMFLVLLANVSGFCFISLIGIKHNHVTIQALPFLALGLGVDDMFLLLHYYKGVPDKTRPTPHVISDLFRLAGVSITLTSFCNAFAFFSGIVIPIPALRDLLASAGIIVIFNYTTMLLAFPALLAWEVDRDRKALESKPDGWMPTPCVRYGPQQLIEEYFSPFMQSFNVRITIAVISIVVFVLSVVLLSTAFPLTFGFKLSDLTPRGSFLAKGFNDYEDHFMSQRTTHDMITTSIDLPANQLNLERTAADIKASRWHSTDVDKSTSWLGWTYKYASQTEGLLNYEYPEVKLPNITGVTVNESLFYTVFHNWRNPVKGGLLSIASQSTDNFGFKWGMDSFLPDNLLMMTRTEYSLNMRVLKTPEDWLQHTEDFHDLMEKHLGKGNAFPEPSGMYLQMEEFSSLKEFFWIAFFLAAFVIFICALIIPVSIKGAALISFTAITSTMEVAAILMMLGLSFSSLVAVVLLMSMGISVEFSAHVIAGFETTPGDRQTRLHHAISHTFVPVCEGGVSSFLSFMLMGLSVYPYIVKYFFLVFLIVIIVGLIHGLLFLPALIGLIGSHDPADEEPDPHASRGSIFGRKISIKPVKEDPIVPVPNPLSGKPKETTEN
eukprot:TRINITY_DN3068_c0_g1_i2.p1 TRINITY_DN3068_c0_g1~~TRINITY_DN3068_c0_g1_i2.p1  ORF type:complete len:1590 (+),score=416.89 TRINITY_DN3068_c0_g1_i2:269-4771(+)